MSECGSAFSRRAFVGASAVVAAASVAVGPTEALAVTSAEKQAEAETALNALNAMEAELDAAELAYHAAVEEQEAAQAKMDEAQTRIDEVSNQIAGLQGRLGSRARSMYRSGSATFVDFLLGASSFQEFTQNWNILEQVNQNDADMVQEMKDLRAEVEAQRAEYEAQEKIAAEKAAEALQIKEEAEATVVAMQQTYDALSAEAAQLLEEERAAREAKEAEIARQQAEAQARNTDTRGNDDSGNYGTPPAYGGSDPYERAVAYLGNAQYRLGSCSPGVFDCSGFVSYCLTGRYERVGSTSTFMGWPRVSDPQPGDVYTNSGHCGIYESPGQMIHCSSTYSNVVRGPARSYDGDMIVVRPPW